MTGAGAIEVPVLIAGAGPTGLSASLLLARHGIASLTVERHPGTSILPRATGINVRSMEVLRSLGVAADVRRAALPVEPRMASSRVLTDGSPGVSPPFRAPDAGVSPTEWTACAQSDLEPILVRAASSQPEAALLFGTELLGFEDTGDGVVARILDRATGATRPVRCRYLVAADGSKSPVRRALGIAMHGPGVLAHAVSIHFRAPLREHLAGLPNFIQVVGNDAVSGMFVPTDARSRWVFGVLRDPAPVGPEWAITAERAVELVRLGAGLPDLAVEVLGTVAWRVEADTAERWRAGSVFLAGDAAHRMTPAGGLGMNTGIQDAHNLAWKLAAVIRGWAGPGLLDTYEIERGPVAERNVHHSGALIRGGNGVDRRSPGNSTSGSCTRRAPWSPTSPRPAGRSPSPAAPGARAPHLWLGDVPGRTSTLPCSVPISRS